MMRQSQYEYVYSLIESHFKELGLTAEQVKKSEYLTAELHLFVVLSFEKEYKDLPEFYELSTVVNSYLTALS